MRRALCLPAQHGFKRSHYIQNPRSNGINKGGFAYVRFIAPFKFLLFLKKQKIKTQFISFFMEQCPRRPRFAVPAPLLYVV